MSEEDPKAIMSVTKPIEYNGNSKMDTSSLAIGLGIGVILGVALGFSIATMIKKPETQTVMAYKATEEAEGVQYIYDEHNRLQSIIPINKKIMLKPPV